jgi:hypothetical protein
MAKTTARPKATALGEDQANDAADAAVPTAAVFCDHCGYLRLHIATALLNSKG